MAHFDFRKISRRNFLKGSFAALGLLGAGLYAWKSQKPKLYAGKIHGASFEIGHLLRNGFTKTPEESEEVEVVIVGGGISGLSAAWWFQKNGYENFRLFELEPEVGGNSKSGQNKTSVFPWGAHYVPLPGSEQPLVRLLFEELGVISGYDARDLPIYDPYFLCHDPEERLFVDGRWHQGLIPKDALTEADQREFQEFFKIMNHYKNAIGTDGKPAFTIPLDFSSQDPAFLKLDQISMKQFLKDKSWDSRFLTWYVDYACRDDYGLGSEKISAWAGIHYFASRRAAAANASPETVLTWPDGNGWIVKKLREKLVQKIQTKSLVYAVQTKTNEVFVDILNTETSKSFRIKAKYLIFAVPRFVASKLIDPLKQNPPDFLKDLHYSPWLVANVSLSSFPKGPGSEIAWDNVSFYSRSLGYVVATHQDLSYLKQKTVITYYRPLDDLSPQLEREKALKKTHAEWAQEIARDLETMHPSIRDQIESIDLMIWGHGMIAPSVGFISSEARQKMLHPLGNIFFAHSDMSGISIFEEAQYRGVEAAKQILKKMV